MALLQLLIPLSDQAPEADDVTAGWVGALVLVLLALAVVFLGFSLVKQLRKAQAAEEAGVYDHDDAPADGTDDEVASRESGADNNGEPHPST
jgi:hypothetical protein